MLYLLMGEYTMEEPKRGFYVPTRWPQDQQPINRTAVADRAFEVRSRRLKTRCEYAGT